MALFDDVLELLAPTRCGGCDSYGALLCDRCLRLLAAYDARSACPRCGAPFGELVCTECWDESFAFQRAVALGVFEGPLARCVVMFKDYNEQRLSWYLGVLLAQRVRLVMGDWPDCVTWVPPSKEAARRRGFDHAGLLARSVACALGVQALPTAYHQRSFDLRALSKEQRKEAVRGAFVPREALEISGKRVLLIDDVMTTGSTLNEVAGLLLEADAREVRAGILARAW